MTTQRRHLALMTAPPNHLARPLGSAKPRRSGRQVHHGNGTQRMFEDDPSVMYTSLHRFDSGSFYPALVGAAAGAVGRGAGRGTTLNVAWEGTGLGDGDYVAAFDRCLMPVARAYDPELVIISAGFDSSRGDPLGRCDLTPRGASHIYIYIRAMY